LLKKALEKSGQARLQERNELNTSLTSTLFNGFYQTETYMAIDAGKT